MWCPSFCMFKDKSLTVSFHSAVNGMIWTHIIYTDGSLIWISVGWHNYIYYHCSVMDMSQKTELISEKSRHYIFQKCVIQQYEKETNWRCRSWATVSQSPPSHGPDRAPKQFGNLCVVCKCWHSLLMNLVKGSANSNNTIADVVNFIFWWIFLLLPAYFYCTLCVGKFTSKIMPMLLFIHTSFCVLNFVPASCQNFVTVAHATQKLK
jgi:hypothetical protein